MKKILYQDKFVFISTFIIGFITHGYAIVNKITNHDDMSILYGCGDGLSFGRWMWKVWTDLQILNNPLVFGLFNLVLMSICAVLLVRAFCVRKLWIACLIGGIWISFPANTSLFFYTQLIPIYSIGILLSVFAIFCFATQKNWRRYVITIICIIFSTACYQAYFAITVVGLSLLLLIKMYRKNMEWKIITYETLSTGFVLLFGIGGYFIATKAVCKFYNVSMSSYQGLNNIGVGYFTKICDMIQSAYHTFFTFHSNLENVFLAKLQDVALPVLFVIVAIVILWRHIKNNNKIAFILSAIIIIIYPALCNLTYFYGADFVYSLMQYTNVFLYFAVLVFMDELSLTLLIQKKYIRVSISIMSIIVGLGIVQNFMLANKEYYAQQRTQTIAIAYLSDVVTQIRSVEGYSQDMPIALIGYCQDESLQAIDRSLCRTNLGGITTAESFVNSVIYYDWMRIGSFQNWLGFSGSFLSAEQAREMLQDEKINEMKNYPADGSVQVIDGVIVVHFSSQF